MVPFYVFHISIFSQGKDRKDMTEHYRSSTEKEIYDLIVYVTHPKEGKYGGFGYSNFGQVCNEDGKRFTTIYAYGSKDCNRYDPPKPIDCSITNRLTLTAEVIYIRINCKLSLFR